MRLTVLIIFITLSFSIAQFDNEMVTDRPDQTESATVIQPFGVQIENGAMNQNTFNSSTGFLQHLARIGIIKNIELRLGATFTRNHYYTIGTKISLLDEKKLLPQTGLLLDVMRTRDIANNREKIEPSFLFAFSYELTNNLGLGINIGADKFVDGFQFKYSTALGFPLSKNTGGYIELYGKKPDNDLTVLFDSGITYLFNQDNQVDLSAGKSINGEDSWFAALGYSIRFMLK